MFSSKNDLIFSTSVHSHMPHIWFQSSWLLDVFPNVAEGLHGVRGVGGAKTLCSCVNVMLAFSTRGYLSRASSQKRFFFNPCALLSDMHSCSKNNCRRARGFTCTQRERAWATTAALDHCACLFTYMEMKTYACLFTLLANSLCSGRGGAYTLTSLLKVYDPLNGYTSFVHWH